MKKLSNFNLLTDRLLLKDGIQQSFIEIVCHNPERLVQWKRKALLIAHPDHNSNKQKAHDVSAHVVNLSSLNMAEFFAPRLNTQIFPNTFYSSMSQDSRMRMVFSAEAKYIQPSTLFKNMLIEYFSLTNKAYQSIEAAVVQNQIELYKELLNIECSRFKVNSELLSLIDETHQKIFTPKVMSLYKTSLSFHDFSNDCNKRIHLANELFNTLLISPEYRKNLFLIYIAESIRYHHPKAKIPFREWITSKELRDNCYSLFLKIIQAILWIISLSALYLSSCLLIGALLETFIPLATIACAIIVALSTFGVYTMSTTVSPWLQERADNYSHHFCFKLAEQLNDIKTMTLAPEETHHLASHRFFKTPSCEEPIKLAPAPLALCDF